MHQIAGDGDAVGRDASWAAAGAPLPARRSPPAARLVATRWHVPQTRCTRSLVTGMPPSTAARRRRSDASWRLIRAAAGQGQTECRRFRQLSPPASCEARLAAGCEQTAEPAETVSSRRTALVPRRGERDEMRNHRLVPVVAGNHGARPNGWAEDTSLSDHTHGRVGAADGAAPRRGGPSRPSRSRAEAIRRRPSPHPARTPVHREGREMTAEALLLQAGPLPSVRLSRGATARLRHRGPPCRPWRRRRLQRHSFQALRACTWHVPAGTASIRRPHVRVRRLGRRRTASIRLPSSA